MAEPLFPQLDQDVAQLQWQRRPTPHLRDADIDADEEVILEILAKADELTIRRIEDADASSREAAMERLGRADKVLPPPGDWITNASYVGGIELWPAVRDTFVEIAESGANIIVLRGASGAAKSFLAESLIQRSIAEIGCMVHPWSALGPLSKGTPMKIPLMHRRYEEARDEMLARLRSRVVDAPWFRENFRPQERAYNLGIGCSHLKFPTLTVKPVPTTQGVLTGQVIPAAWFTECNEYDIIERSSRKRDQPIYDVGLEVFKECLTRLKRFHRPLPVPVRYVFDSTERYEGDLTSRLSDILPRTGLKHIVVQKSQWEMKPGAMKGPWFHFAKPVKGKRGEVVETKARREELEGSRREVVKVPVGDEEEYLVAARETPDVFSRDLGGWPVDAISRFIDNPEHIARCVRERAAYLTGLQIDVDPARAMDDMFLLGHSQVDWDKLCTFDSRSGLWRPRVLPDVHRAMHFDLASGGKSGKDFIGVAMGAMAEMVERLPRVWYDFALRLLRDGVRYDFEKAREWVEDFRRHGFRISLVTFDSHQSVDFQNILGGWGYQVDQISMIRNMDGYLAFESGYHKALAMLPAWEDSVVFEELVQLERKIVSGKEVIEHRPKKHDDVAQAAAAVYWQLKLRGGLAGVGIMGGKPDHPRTMERRIAEAAARLWDKTNEGVPAATIDKERRRTAKESRKRDRRTAKELRDEIARLRAQGVRGL